MRQPLYLPLVLLAAVVGLLVAAFAWRSRDQPGARPLAVFVVAASVWTVTEGLALATAGVGQARFWTAVGLSLSGVIPLAWLVTVLAYTGRDRWLRPRVVGALAVEPLVFAGLVWTNAGHGLVWTDGGRAFVGEYSAFAVEFGVGFWAHQVYVYLLVAAGALLLVRLLLGAASLFRSQATALLVAIAVPMVGNAVYIFRLFPRGLDPTGVGYVVSGVVIAGALFRRRLLGLAPVARELGREAALSDLADSVLILDDGDRIVDANPAAEELLGTDVEACLGRPLGTVVPELSSVLGDGDATRELRLERGGAVRYYDVRVSELYRGYGTVSGRLVSLREITERRQREQRLDVLNRLLRHNLRNELNVVRGNVELARSEVEDSTVTSRLTDATDTVDTIVERSDKVGTLSRTLEREGTGPVDLSRLLPSEPVTDRPAVTVDLPDRLPVAAGASLSVAFEELLTNALEHNDGDPTVTVTVDESRSDEDYVVVAVRDDGPGITDQEWQTVVAGEETPLRHTSGIGLWLVNWVVEKFGGSLSFENHDDGCTVRVRLPRADGPVADS
jgi:PAS domain S-box-containing protein